MQKHSIAWFVQFIENHHRQRAALLEKYGFNVRFFSDLSSLEKELKRTRFSICFFGDFGSIAIVRENILSFVRIPAIKRARKILMIDKSHQDVMKIAAQNGFDDIISMQLDHREWLYRILYHLQDSKAEFLVKPKLSYSVPKKAIHVYVPARVLWISKNQIRLETPITDIENGSKIAIRGALVKHLGMDQLSLTVQTVEASPVLHQFKKAVVCSYKLPTAIKDQANDVLQGMQFIDAGRQARIFIAARSKDLRSSLIEKLDSPRVFLDFALTVKSISETPKHFEPDLILVEDCFVNGEAKDVFCKMLSESVPDLPVLVLGSLEEETKDMLSEDFPDHSIHARDFIPQNFEEILFAEYLDTSQLSEGDSRVNLLPQDDFSYAELMISCNLTYIHPLTVGTDLPFDVTPGSIIGLQHNVFEGMIFAKVLEQKKKPESKASETTKESILFITNYHDNDRTRFVQKLLEKQGDPLSSTSGEKSAIKASDSGDSSVDRVVPFQKPRVLLPTLPKKPPDIVELRKTSDVLSEVAQVSGKNFLAILLSRNTRIIAMYVCLFLLQRYFLKMLSACKGSFFAMMSHCFFFKTPFSTPI